MRTGQRLDLFLRASWIAGVSLSRSFFTELRGRIANLTLHRAALDFLIVAVAYLAITEIFSKGAVIDVVSVPKGFQEEGYTVEVVAEGIREKIVEMAKVAERNAGREPIELLPIPRAPDFQVPGANVSLRAAIRYVQQRFHVGPDHITVQILSSQSGTPSSARGGKQRLEVAIGSEDGRIAAASAEITLRQPEEILPSIAQEVLAEADPDLLGVYLYDQGKINDAITMYKKAVELDPHSPYPYNGWGGRAE